jgi:NADH-quinone oxidoreductase subunit F
MEFQEGAGALLRLDPAALVDRAIESGLRGRGGGWFPAGRKWRAVRVEGGDAIVVANGAEGEPGSVKDRFVMTRRPADVVDGLRLAARAVGAREAVIFLKASFDAPALALGSAVRAGSGDGLSISVRRGDDSYITGEETALLESLEGRRPWPRPKPPLPAAVGYLGRPTLVQNVETLSRVPSALANPEAFRQSEKTFVSLWGDVGRPGVYEVPLGKSLRRLVDDEGGGAPQGVSMVFPAGPSAPPLTADALDTPLDPDALRSAGSALGTASVLVVGADACPLTVGASLAAFFERETCGQCPPCTVGTRSLSRILRAIDAGEARGKDLADVAEIGGFMSDHGYCAHSRTAATSVRGLLSRFEGDVAAHLAAGRCLRPSSRPRDPFAPGSPERVAIEASL